MPSNYDSEDQAYFNKEEEAQVDMMVAHAVEEAAKGENVEQLLEVLLATLPPAQREKIKKKFAAALKKAGLRAPAGENTDIPARGTLARLREALTITAQQAYQRVVQLARSRPDVAARIQEAGQILAQSGVTVQKIQIREAELGTLAPSAVAKSQQRDETGRGA